MQLLTVKFEFQNWEHIRVILRRPSSALRWISGLDGRLSPHSAATLIFIAAGFSLGSLEIHTDSQWRCHKGVECEEGVKRGKKSTAGRRGAVTAVHSRQTLAKTYSCCLKNVFGGGKQEGKWVYVTAKRKRSHWISHMAAGAAEDRRCCPWLTKKKPAEGLKLG